MSPEPRRFTYGQLKAAVRLGVRLPQDQVERLDAIATARGETRSSMLRILLEEAIVREEQRTRE